MFPIKRWAIILLLAAQAVYAQDQDVLTFKYRPGGMYRYRSAITFTSQQEMNGQEMNIDGGVNSLVRLEVTSGASDSIIAFLVNYEEISTFIKSNMLDTVLDQKSLAGKRSRVEMDRFGKELSRKMVDSTGAAGNTNLMNLGFDPPGSFFRLPGSRMPAGGKWTAVIRDSTALGDGYTAQTGTIGYTLNGMEQKNGHPCLRIDFVSKSDHAGKMQQAGMDLVIEGSGDTKGTIWFDTGAGILVSRESTTIQDLTLAITSPLIMTIPMTQRIKSTCSLVEN